MTPGYFSVSCKVIDFSCFSSFSNFNIQSSVVPKRVPFTVIGKLGCKWTLVVCQIPYCVYIATMLNPSLYLCVPAAVLLGLAAAPLWTAKCEYLSHLRWKLRSLCRIPWLSFSISTQIFIYRLGPLVRGPPRTGGSNLYETRKAMWSYHYLDKIFNHIRTWRSWVSSSHHMIIDVKGWLHCFEGFNRPAVVTVINCLW